MQFGGPFGGPILATSAGDLQEKSANSDLQAKTTAGSSQIGGPFGGPILATSAGDLQEKSANGDFQEKTTAGSLQWVDLLVVQFGQLQPVI